jgi:enediyne biosynthesis thioesterase
MTLQFEYWRGAQMVARGEQRIACMRRQEGKLMPAPVPEGLREALQAYTE